MPDLNFIQSIGRKVHTASSGIEIQRQFYFEPYSAFPEVLEALQGSVTREAGDQPWNRILPAVDPYITSCYCNEARVDLADRDSLASSPDISLPPDPDGDRASLLRVLETIRESPRFDSAGGVVTASYRPLITAKKNPKDEDAFDWIDPQFSPGFRQARWPEGFHCRVKHAVGLVPYGLPADLAETISVPVFDFTIRRILVGEPPWDAISICSGCINRDPWPANPDEFTFPQFPRGTLKFEGAQIENRLDSHGNRIYEITYNFSWLNLLDGPVFDRVGNAPEAWASVTWNHVLVKPWWLFKPFPTGWYFVLREKDVYFLGFKLGVLGINTDAGSLYKMLDFDALFRL